MGIEKLNKKNPPTPAGSPSATFTLVEVLLHLVEVLLLTYGGSSTRKAGRGSEAKRRPTMQMLMQIVKLIFSREQPRIPNKIKQQTLVTQYLACKFESHRQIDKCPPLILPAAYLPRF